ncbi:MAG: queuosine precursor transporter [Rickettsiaceae bacterium]|nr:queuosine precursor transporter [Rickettsiaceae bacterium]
MITNKHLANKTQFGIFHYLTITYAIIYLISNIAAVKVVEYGPWSLKSYDFGPYPLDAGTWYFPLLYIINDILTEIYGFKNTRKTIWISMFSTAISMLLFYLVVGLDGIDTQETKGFNAVFTFSPLILFASVTSFVVGEYFNSVILSKLKLKFAGKYFILRATFSTAIASAVESSIFATIAFSHIYDFTSLANMVMLLVLIKVGYELLSSPVTLYIIKLIKKNEQCDHYDYDTKFSFLPFAK